MNVQVNRSNLSNENTVYSPDDIKNAVMIDILPLGFEYVPQSFRYEDFTGLPENQIQGYKVEYNKTFVDPEIIENF